MKLRVKVLIVLLGVLGYGVSLYTLFMCLAIYTGNLTMISNNMPDRSASMIVATILLLLYGSLFSLTSMTIYSLYIVARRGNND